MKKYIDTDKLVPFKEVDTAFKKKYRARTNKFPFLVAVRYGNNRYKVYEFKDKTSQLLFLKDARLLGFKAIHTVGVGR